MILQLITMIVFVTNVSSSSNTSDRRWYTNTRDGNTSPRLKVFTSLCPSRMEDGCTCVPVSRVGSGGWLAVVCGGVRCHWSDLSRCTHSSNGRSSLSVCVPTEIFINVGATIAVGGAMPLLSRSNRCANVLYSNRRRSTNQTPHNSLIMPLAKRLHIAIHSMRLCHAYLTKDDKVHHAGFLLEVVFPNHQYIAWHQTVINRFEHWLRYVTFLSLVYVVHKPHIE